MSDLHEAVAIRLRGAEQRYTAGRRALVEVLIGSDAPLTIPQILVRDPDLAQSSAYRNLVVLEQAAVVQRIVTNDDHARYELAEDLTDHHHHHLICASCGDVVDFTVPPGLEADLDAALRHAADVHGFATDHHRLDLVGQCARCR